MRIGWAMMVVVGACGATEINAPKTMTTGASSMASESNVPFPSVSTSVASSAAATATASAAPSIVVAPLPTSPDRVFTTAPPIAFNAALPTPKQTPIAKHTHFSGASRDLKSFVVGDDKGAMLLSPAAPTGLPWSANAPQTDGARFSPDNSRVAVMQQLGPLVVVSMSDGKTIWRRDDGVAGECEVRWLGDDRLRFHGMSRDLAARSWTVDLVADTAVASGPPLGADACTSSMDGERWLVFVDYEAGQPTSAIRLRDASSGAVTEMVRSIASIWVLSPTADRACWLDRRQNALFCRRSSDLAVEQILAGVDVQGLEIDDAGARMLIGSAKPDADGEPVAVMLLADFESGTVRRLDGIRLNVGATMHLLSGGHVVAAGSANGVEIFDVDAKKRAVAKRSNALIVHALPGEPRAFVLGAEAGGTAEDLYLVTLP